MDDRRFAKFLWITKASLFALLIGAGLEVVSGRVHIGRLDPNAAAEEPRLAAEPAAPPQTRERLDYSEIAQSDLFNGTDDPKGKTAHVDPPQALASPAAAEELGLSLIGSVAGGPTTSRAIIQNTKTNTSDSYRIGDTVAAAVVENIQRGAVVLRYQGRFLALKQCSGKAESKEPRPPICSTRSAPWTPGSTNP